MPSIFEAAYVDHLSVWSCEIAKGQATSVKRFKLLSHRIMVYYEATHGKKETPDRKVSAYSVSRTPTPPPPGYRTTPYCENYDSRKEPSYLSVDARRSATNSSKCVHAARGIVGSKAPPYRIAYGASNMPTLPIEPTSFTTPHDLSSTIACAFWMTSAFHSWNPN